jgi:antitoxin VapB
VIRIFVDVRGCMPYTEIAFFMQKAEAMSINIKNKEADRLLAELKNVTGKGASELVLDLLRKEHARVAAERPPPVNEAEFERILAATREMQRLWRESPVVDPRSPDEILGYDENGLPT